MTEGSSGDLEISNMVTSLNGTIFHVTGPLCGEFTGPGEFPAQRPVTQSCDVFFDLRLNKRLSKQPWGRWFETPPWSLWRQCNESRTFGMCSTQHLRKVMFTRRGTCWTNCRLNIIVLWRVSYFEMNLSKFVSVYRIENWSSLVHVMSSRDNRCLTTDATIPRRHMASLSQTELYNSIRIKKTLSTLHYVNVVFW